MIELPTLPPVWRDGSPKKVFLSLTVTFFLLFVFCGPLSAEPVQPGPKDRCPICGMFVAAYPDWVAQIEFKDGSREFFDGPKDLFHFYLGLPEANNPRSREAVAHVYVTEYYSTKLMEAESLLYVRGSDVLGPMGKEMIPVQGRKPAETFKQDHNGEDIFSFDQITLEALPSMTMHHSDK